MLAMVAGAVAEGLRRLSEGANGGALDDVGGAFCWYSSSYVPVYNGAGMFFEHLFNRSTLLAIEEFYEQRGRPYALVTLDGLVSESSERLSRLNYVQFEYSPAMWLEGETRRWQEGPGGYRVSRVESLSDLAAFRLVLSRVFSISPYEVNLVLTDRVLEFPAVRHYLAWSGSEPVATTSLVLSGPMAGIWNVGTLPEYRRRGIAAELMHNAVSEALAFGYTSSMLLATFSGLPLYERLGYRTVSTVRMFERKRGM
jgi:GNAT superfamily N-acetyltransferase